MNLFYNFSATPLQRQRVTRDGHVYNPSENTKFRHRIHVATLEQLPQDFIPFSGNLKVGITFIKTTQPSYRRFGDIDNLVKAVFDAYNNFIWNDDSQVIELHAKKIAGIENKFRVNIVPLDEDLILF